MLEKIKFYIQKINKKDNKMSIEAIRDSLLLDKNNLTKIYNKAMKHWNELVHQK